MHRWLWMDYVARDPAGALDFYGSAVGFRNEVHETRDTFIYYLLSTDRPRAGLFLSPWTRDTAAWLPYGWWPIPQRPRRGSKNSSPSQ